MVIQLHQLPTLVDRRKKRVGRGLGSGRGAKSGRGTTRHQKAREAIPLSFEGGQNRLIKKLPLLRGKGRNSSRKPKPYLVPLQSLKKIKEGEVITIATLIKHKIIKKDLGGKPMKIVGDGAIDKALTIKLPISQKAAAAVVAAGGQIPL